LPTACRKVEKKIKLPQHRFSSINKESDPSKESLGTEHLREFLNCAWISKCPLVSAIYLYISSTAHILNA